jgi:hypothetical protein
MQCPVDAPRLDEQVELRRARPRPQGAEQRDGQVREATPDRPQRDDRARIGPLQVLDHHRDGPLQRANLHRLDELVHEAELEPGDGGGVAGGPRRRECERLAERRERAPTVELVRASLAHREGEPPRLRGERLGEPRLADARFTLEQRAPRRAVGDGAEPALERRTLARATEQHGR